MVTTYARKNDEHVVIAKEMLEPLDRIRELAPALNAERDRRDSIVLHINRMLGGEEYSVGMPASVPCGTGDCQMWLIYDRVGGTYRIAIRAGEGATDWPSCPGWMRREAFKHLPALLEAIAEKVALAVQTAKQENQGVMTREVLW